jgi:hypothetical protein
MTAETTASKQRGRPFPKGRSGNPRGRPLGARNAATVVAEQLLDGEAEALTRKVIEAAKGGDMVALRICLDRILPPRRERPVRFKLPELGSAADASKAMAAITTAAANGELTPYEAGEFAGAPGLLFVHGIKLIKMSEHATNKNSVLTIVCC